MKEFWKRLWEGFTDPYVMAFAIIILATGYALAAETTGTATATVVDLSNCIID